MIAGQLTPPPFSLFSVRRSHSHERRSRESDRVSLASRLEDSESDRPSL